jgi:hypothetical protein
LADKLNTERKEWKAESLRHKALELQTIGFMLLFGMTNVVSSLLIGSLFKTGLRKLGRKIHQLKAKAF